MPDYPASFWQERTYFRSTYHRYAEAVSAMWGPDAAFLEIGAGAAYMSERLMLLGHSVLALDAEPAAEPFVPPVVAPEWRCVDVVAEPPRWAWVSEYRHIICVEVLEHIEEADLPAALRWFEQGERLFVTAARPGQGGRHHVNEQPPEYWQEKFGALGYLPDRPCAAAWAHVHPGATPWVHENAMFFRREG